MTGADAGLHIGTAGWSVPRSSALGFPGEGSHLQRYARVLGCAEINSSFHRSHQVGVYAGWAAQTPPGFRFAVKLPRAITHDARLRGARLPLQRFIAEVSGLGDRLAVLLVQLPPSLRFEARPARKFFGLLRSLFHGAIVCEPRHVSWFTPAVNAWLVKYRVGRVAADPARWPAAALPGGWLGPAGDGASAIVYCRWHGAPRTYWSSYEDAWLQERASSMQRWPPGTDCWAIFDNTASGAATPNALAYSALMGGSAGRLPGPSSSRKLK